MAAVIPKEYKIEKNIPVVRAGVGKLFDETLPEFVIMMKLKVGDSFEFPRGRVNYIHNCRVHLRKQGSPLCFTFSSRDSFNKNPKMLTGRCWRIKDGSTRRAGPKKNRPKGAAINLNETNS